MSRFLSSAFFAAAAVAEVTTPIWVPSSFHSDEDIRVRGSVVAVDGETTTLALVFDTETYSDTYPDYYSTDSATITIEGTTAVRLLTTISDEYDGDMYTVSYDCTRGKGGSGSATCVYSSNGPDFRSSYCGPGSTDIYTVTDTYTPLDDPFTVITTTDTITYADYLPEGCLTDTNMPEISDVFTRVLDGENFETYQVTITAGEEKLSATAGATPSNIAASSTASSSGTTGSSTSSSASSSSTSATPAQSGSSSPSQSTPAAAASSGPPSAGAAAPMITVAPLLAGLGAAVAALVL